MGARLAIGARWWGGSYRKRLLYVFPEPEVIVLRNCDPMTVTLADLSPTVRRFWETPFPKPNGSA